MSCNTNICNDDKPHYTKVIHLFYDNMCDECKRILDKTKNNGTDIEKMILEFVSLYDADLKEFPECVSDKIETIKNLLGEIREEIKKKKEDE